MFPRSCIAGLAALATLSAPVVSLAGPIFPSPSGSGPGKVMLPAGVVNAWVPKIKSGYGTISKMTPNGKHPSTKWVKNTFKSPASAASDPTISKTSGDVQGAFNPNQGAVTPGGAPITMTYPPQN